MKNLKLLLLPLAAILMISCASFVNSSRKSLYVAGTLADGGMRTYAVYWKSQTNQQGDTPALEQQRSNVMALAKKVGAGLALADQTLTSYEQNVGTNTTTKAVAEAILTTAISDVAQLTAFIASLTGNTNFTQLP
jgi:hypothetical protein